MIPVYKPYFTGKEKIYVNECLDSSWISSRGEFIKRFETAFCQFTGAAAATAVANGTVALHLALEAIGVGAGDEVIVPSFTYVASVNTILQCGAIPVFAESDPVTLNVIPSDIEARITPKTKAVMCVHLYGLPCDMAAISDLCKRHGLKLIEDAAEAFGSRFNGQHVGTFGDIAAFSFFGNKTITTGEGGMVVSMNPDTIARAAHLKAQGVSKTREYWHDCLAYNYRMTNICAAIGLAQIESADAILAKKRQIAGWYRDGLSDLPVRFHDEMPNTTHSYWMCSMTMLDEGLRDPVRAALKAADIETRPMFPPAHLFPHCANGQTLPNAERISASGMNLPSYPDLTQSDVARIVDVIRTVTRTAKAA